MNSFKVNKPKALVNSLLQVANDSLDKISESLMATNPELAMTVMAMKMSFGARLAYKQDEINQFVQYLIDNESIFDKDLLSSKNFRDGLTVFLDDYLKIRGDDKLKIARDIFTDFSKSNNMPLYPIEAYDDTLMRISQAGLRFIGFLHTDIIPMKDNPPYDGVDLGYTGSLPTRLSDSIDIYLNNNPDKEEEVDILVSEMKRLGIIEDSRPSRQMALNTDVSNKYDLSDYGNKFISIIKP